MAITVNLKQERPISGVPVSEIIEKHKHNARDIEQEPVQGNTLVPLPGG